MEPQWEDDECEVCCHLDVSKAATYPKRIDIDFDDSTELKRLPRSRYEERSSAGCQYCTLIMDCIADVPWKRIGLRLAPDNPPTILNGTGDADRIIYKLRPDDPIWDTIPVRKSIQVADIDHATAWIKARLSDCCTSHQLCKKSTTVGPKRLLKLSQGIKVSLVDCPVQIPAYVALSYCWGGEQECKLTKAMIDGFYNEIPWNNLTRLHQDVFNLCQKLGLEYLWIDALCIIQDDPDDWADQAAVMADIYENAHLTVSTNFCPNPRQQLFVREDPKYGGGEKSLRISEDGVPFIASRGVIEVGHHREFYIRNSNAADPLESRGWCFQESRLSRRMVSFTSEELQWQCRKSRYCECGDPVTDDMNKMLIYEGMKPIKELSAHRLWGRLLQRYTRTKLTMSKDRLVALAGLASRIALFTKSTYVAGLWRNSLASNLLWKSKSPSRLFSKNYLAPTFSWASVDSPVEMVELLEDAGPDEWSSTVETVESHIDLKSATSPFGEVTGGFLRLKGIVRRAKLQFQKSGKITVKPEGVDQIRGISVLPDGRLTCAKTFDGISTVVRLRVNHSKKLHDRSSECSSPALTDMLEDTSDSSGNDEIDTDDTEDSDTDDDISDDDSDDSDLEDEDSSDESDSDVYDISDDSSNDSNSSSQKSSKAHPVPVHLLHLGFLSVEDITSYCLVLGRSPTHENCYERLGLLKWKHKRGWRDAKAIKTLPKSTITIT